MCVQPCSTTARQMLGTLQYQSCKAAYTGHCWIGHLLPQKLHMHRPAAAIFAFPAAFRAVLCAPCAAVCNAHRRRAVHCGQRRAKFRLAFVAPPRVTFGAAAAAVAAATAAGIDVAVSASAAAAAAAFAAATASTAAGRTASCAIAASAAGVATGPHPDGNHAAILWLPRSLLQLAHIRVDIFVLVKCDISPRLTLILFQQTA